MSSESETDSSDDSQMTQSDSSDDSSADESDDSNEDESTIDVTNAAKLWHQRLGHARSVTTIKALVKNGKLPHISCSKVDCEDFRKGKFRNQFKGSLTQATQVGNLHVDTKGTVEVSSIHGHQHFLTIVEEFSRYKQAYPMKNKGEASQLLLNFVTKFEKQSGHVINRVHADNGSEVSRAFEKLSATGVETTKTTTYTPESNGLVERTHGVLLSMIRSCLIQSKPPQPFWNFALRHVTECLNLVPHSTTGKVPYEVCLR